MTDHTRPAGCASAARFTKRAAGSISVAQIGANELSAWRVWIVTATGCFGHGKRTDSWNVRPVVLTSAVVSHSP